MNDQHGAQVGVLLECFGARGAAGKARHGLDAQLRSAGDVLLDTVVLQVDSKHHASVHDPRRVTQGTLTAALTWGLFGLLAGGLRGFGIWAVLGAVCGGLYAFYAEHLLRRDELTRIGARLPAGSSALLTFATTSDPRGLVRAAAAHGPTTASVAGIGEDLEARVFAGGAEPVEMPVHAEASAVTPTGSAPTSLILMRYPDPGAARQVASQAAPSKEQEAVPVQVELVIRDDGHGRRHVADPSQGVRAWARADVVSWGAFGVVVGALAGALGDGALGTVGDALLTGLAWAAFGLVAGALYGLWAGRAVSARRLKALHGLLTPRSSMLVAWADGPLGQGDLDRFATPGSKRLILRFSPTEGGGAVLEAA
jgi:hypothetical protein